ncbi:MAG: tRNA (guanosine(37)-N1)-methyltransferase TrmD [Lachnospiraceae bacterium]|nr:tRNA (guanosine(37)-N1)-methyltransferase TrmD [Lachnospiraceae bacterium]
MHYHVLTLFPDMITQTMSHSITGRAQQKELLHLQVTDIRDFSQNKYHKVDDYPYGGGAGMVMEPEPVFLAYEYVCQQVEQEGRKKPKVLFMTPQGKTLTQNMVETYAKEEDLVFLCGHYEGIDERVLESIVDENVSIGDYVLTGGELPALVMMDAISRFVPGVLHNDVSAITDTFTGSLLEYPQYTRPVQWREKEVPPVLLSGHHQKIDQWRRQHSLLRTFTQRPDLFEKVEFTKADCKWMRTQPVFPVDLVNTIEQKLKKPKE